MNQIICFALSNIVMTIVFLATLSLPTFAQTPKVASSGAQSFELRPVGQMRKDMRAFSKNAKSKDSFVRRAAMVDLCVLHWEVATDPRYEESEQLKSIRVVAKKRLQQFVDGEKKSQKKTQATLASSSSASRYKHRLERKIVDSHSTSTSDLMDSLIGGPSLTSGYLGGNLAPPFDHSEELIALIESTITPGVWKNTGTGEATIHYYQPSLALVVTASQQTQDRILSLLYKLR